MRSEYQRVPSNGTSELLWGTNEGIWRGIIGVIQRGVLRFAVVLHECVVQNFRGKNAKPH